MSQVLGADLSAIQPDVGALPNCEWLRDDVDEEWIEYGIFDYIHLRAVCTCFNDPRKVMRQAYQHLNPGGWIEYQDPFMQFEQANPAYGGTAFRRWCQAMIEGAAIMGRDVMVPGKYRAWMAEEGCKFIFLHKLAFFSSLKDNRPT